jgi:pimeloyl-ACP methyl ester carboxylesterase
MKRNVRNFLFSLIAVFLLVACGKDCPTPPPLPEWKTEVVDTTFPYKVRLTWRPALGSNQNAVAFVCGLGYRCGGDGAGVSYYSQDLLQRVQDLGLATALIDLSGSGNANRDEGDRVGLDQRAAELYRARWEVLGQFGVVYVGHSIGAATALRAAAKFGSVNGVAGLGFTPFSKPPAVSDKVIMSLANQGPYIQFPMALRKAFFFYDPGTDAAGYAKDVVLSDPFPRKLFSDALALFQDASPLELGKIRVPVYVQQYQMDAVYQPTQNWSYAKTDLFQDVGHSAELHKDPGPTRTALLAWLKQFVK